jgi:hypothetical protein
MPTYTFRKVSKFDLTGETQVMNSKNSSKQYGSITETKKTMMFGNQTWTIYDCIRIKHGRDVIFVDDSPIDEWETREDFRLFLNARKDLLIAEGPAKNVKGLLDHLNKYNDDVDITKITFNFDKIANRLAQVKQAWIAGNEVGISTVAYMGSKAKDKDEVKTAIDDGTASYLGTVIDIDNRRRSMGFSQKGAIILVNANQPMSIDEKLNLTYTTYKYVTKKG